MQKIDNKIEAIDEKSIHRICSGQVIFDLANVLKELVENSLDAEATEIIVSIAGKGLELIQVEDNGTGIESKDFELVAKKYCTSKIRNFSDFLSGVDSYGFRGEALSSLCAISDVSILTKHHQAECASRLEYDSEGTLISHQKLQVSDFPHISGTKIMARNLFKTIPVRHQDFLNNVKKEMVKAHTLMQAYGLIGKNISISCIDLDKQT